jgi:hypothetical protein
MMGGTKIIFLYLRNMVGSKINVLCTQNVQKLLCELEIRILLEEINYEPSYTVQN